MHAKHKAEYDIYDIYDICNRNWTELNRETRHGYNIWVYRIHIVA